MIFQMENFGGKKCQNFLEQIWLAKPSLCPGFVNENLKDQMISDVMVNSAIDVPFFHVIEKKCSQGMR